MNDEELLASAKRLKSACYSCQKCSLGQNKVDDLDPHVFAVGNLASKIFFQAESPGLDETKQKQPLVGRSGKVFNKFILGGLGLTRSDVWITNTVLCRPPKNRNPLPEEIKACSVYYDEQIKLVKPNVIVTLGAIPFGFLTGIFGGITKLAAKPIKSNKYDLEVFPLLHPSYILRSGKYELLSEHVRLLKDYLTDKGII